MLEYTDEKIQPAYYTALIQFECNKHRGSGYVYDNRIITVKENEIESFISLINSLKERLSDGNVVVPSDYYGDYILENEDTSFSIDIPTVDCSFSSYFYKIKDIEISYHEKHAVKKVKIK